MYNKASYLVATSVETRRDGRLLTVARTVRASKKEKETGFSLLDRYSFLHLVQQYTRKQREEGKEKTTRTGT